MRMPEKLGVGAAKSASFCLMNWEVALVPVDGNETEVLPIALASGRSFWI